MNKESLEIVAEDIKKFEGKFVKDEEKNRKVFKEVPSTLVLVIKMKNKIGVGGIFAISVAVLAVAVAIAELALSGCTEPGVRKAENNTTTTGTDILTNANNATATATVNASERAENVTASAKNNFSLVLNLEKPPEEVVGGEQK